MICIGRVYAVLQPHDYRIMAVNRRTLCAHVAGAWMYALVCALCMFIDTQPDRMLTNCVLLTAVDES